VGDVGRLDGGGLLAAALDATPAYVRAEVGRLLPGTGAGTVPDARGEEWSRERLFAALAELLAAVAARSGRGAGLVVEDVHWADSATLDCLTYLARGARHGGGGGGATRRRGGGPLAGRGAGLAGGVRGRGRGGGSGDAAGPAVAGGDSTAGGCAGGWPGAGRGRGRAVCARGGKPVLHRATGGRRASGRHGRRAAGPRRAARPAGGAAGGAG